MPDRKQAVSLFWFRRDLRLEDNHGLYQALKDGNNVQPIFIFDTNILDKLDDTCDRRISFIYHQIQALKSELIALGSDLTVFHGDPLTILDQLSEGKLDALYSNRDYEPYAKARDKAVYEMLDKKGIPFRGYKDHVIFDKDEIAKDDGDPYVVFTPYSRKWKTQLEPLHYQPYPSAKCTHNLKASLKPENLISLDALGFQKHEEDWPEQTVDIDVIKNYHETRDIPGIMGTSRLSVHLRFGTISIRHLVKHGLEHNEKWLNELIWRDFYQSILWKFPHVASSCFRSKYDRIPWRNNEQEFKTWCEGKTGYPIVDAGMRELNATGLIHNRVRMVVSSFLTKHLLIDWRWGEAYFASKLLDYDMASNNGGWQWAAGSGVDAAPYFRVFNPTLQTERFDPNLVYVRKWVTDLDSPDYPERMVDHKMARERAIRVYKEALTAV
ncbi:MAG: deoxyribodipyrimidine photo-lyase [Flavobacteriales bacterium]|nr:deoxyribodipyrimidine photo-lyase [Flavobacteriales bacterium]